MADVFISYSHADEAWKDRLRQQLQVLQLEGDLSVWDDRDIVASDDWRGAIDRALGEVRVAVLLVSAAFLTSDFVRGVEVPRFLQRRMEEGLRVVPVIVRPCAWKEVPWLAAIAAHPRDGKPLMGLSEFEAESALADLARIIKRLLGDAPAKPTFPSTPPTPARPSKRKSAEALPAPEATDKPVTVLFLAANPRDTTRLALDEEARDIEAKIRAAEHRDLLQLETRWAVRPDDLLQAMNEHEPTVLHFSGHGEPDGIVLQGDDGRATRVAAPALAALCRAFVPRPRLVVLNACYSEPQARALVEVVDCAVGLPATVGDRAARTFAASFYRALGFGRPVQQAYDQALVALQLAGLEVPDGGPSLLTRQGIDPATLVLVTPDHP